MNINTKQVTKGTVKKARRTVKKAIKANVEHLEAVNHNSLLDGVNLSTKWDKTHALEHFVPCLFPVGKKAKMMDIEALSLLLTVRLNKMGLSYEGEVIDLDGSIDKLRERNTIKGVKLGYLQYYNGVLSSFFKGLDDVTDVQPYVGKHQGLQILSALKSVRDNMDIVSYKLVS